MSIDDSLRRTSESRPSWNWADILARCALTAVLLSSGCASLGPCALYDCPSVEVRHTEEWGCARSEVAVAVNHDTKPRSFFVRRWRGYPGTEGSESSSGPFTLPPGGEMTLGCTLDYQTDAVNHGLSSFVSNRYTLFEQK